MRKLFIALSLVVASHGAFAAHAGKTVGAIRWDPFYIATETAERPTLEASLAQPAYQGRAPACATITSTATKPSMSFGSCSSQAQIDSEINAAHTAGLDYWAYDWYGPSDPMQTAWNYHQTSSVRNLMNWALVFSSYTLFNTSVSGAISTYTGYLNQSNYQKVTVSSVSRPLVYLLSDGTSLSTLAASITTFRAAVVASGLNTPYIVLLVGASPGIVATTGADAIAFYATAPLALAGAYSALDANTQAYWTAMVATSQNVVPTSMTGWDRRPRIAIPNHYDNQQFPWIGAGQYFAAGTPSAIAAEVTAMLTWMGANSSACPSQTGLIYSWDEHDEGGSTLNPSLGTGSAILNAVAGAL